MSNKSSIEWTDVPGFGGYQVTDFGSMRGPSSKTLKAVPNKGGYLRVQVRQGGKGCSVFVHKAVLLAFTGPCPDGQEARHLDGNKLNNERSNLIWGTKLENADDKRRHGTIPRGERSGSAKLTEESVRQIRERIGSATLRQLAREFNVSHTVIRRAANGITWSHVR